MERGVLVERPISPQLIVVGSILRQKHKQRSCLALGPTVAWLKASVQLGDGRLEPRTAGTPQGGVVSPLLANLFLNYVFDCWMAKTSVDTSAPVIPVPINLVFWPIGAASSPLSFRSVLIFRE
jgi:hypothetical protein